MKHIKMLAAAILALVAFAFAACGGGYGGAKVKESADKLLVIEATETGGSLEDALKSLQEAGKLTYEGTGSGENFYITSINGYAADVSKNEYWAQYTTLATLDNVVYSSTEYGSYTYGGQELGYSSYGVAGMPLVKGEIYVFVIESW